MDYSNITPLPQTHNSFESAVEVDNYPYGGYRTKMRYWIEAKKNHGQRVVSCSLNPKTQRWNKPHAGTYSDIVVLFVDNSNGHIENTTFSGSYSSISAAEFREVFGSVLNELQLRHLIRFEAAEVAREKYGANFYTDKVKAYEFLNQVLREMGYPNLQVKLVKKETQAVVVSPL